MTKFFGALTNTLKAIRSRFFNGSLRSQPGVPLEEAVAENLSSCSEQQEGEKEEETMSRLERRLRELIAKKHGVSPDDINAQFIQEKREELYNRPDHRFIGERGGMDASDLKVQNKAEIEAERRAATKFLEQETQKKP